MEAPEQILIARTDSFHLLLPGGGVSLHRSTAINCQNGSGQEFRSLTAG